MIGLTEKRAKLKEVEDKLASLNAKLSEMMAGRCRLTLG
jgi:hypothetical protein